LNGLHYKFIGVPPPNPSWISFAQATAFPDRRGGRRYTGVKLLAGLSKDTSHYGLSGYFKTLGIEGLALEPPQCLLGDAVDLVPIGIPSLRRKVNAVSNLWSCCVYSGPAAAQVAAWNDDSMIDIV
jgi:hypothetical protein